LTGEMVRGINKGRIREGSRCRNETRSAESEGFNLALRTRFSTNNSAKGRDEGVRGRADVVQVLLHVAASSIRRDYRRWRG